MTDTTAEQPAHCLTLERTLAAPLENVWRCWTTPDLLEQWFCPKPWFVSDVRISLQAGGVFASVINGPDGERFDNVGVFLEVEPMQRLVFTDALRPGWIPAQRAFMVCEVRFAADGDHTGYRARAMHWDQAAREEHEKMGFHEGWGAAADQLETLARSL